VPFCSDSPLILRSSLSDTDRPTDRLQRLVGVNSSKKQSCVNSILPVQCPAGRAARTPGPAGCRQFPFCAATCGVRHSFLSERWRRNKISLISLRLSPPPATRDYLDASARGAPSNPNVPLAPPQLYHYNGRCRHRRMDFHYAASDANC